MAVMIGVAIGFVCGGLFGMVVMVVVAILALSGGESDRND